MPIPSAVRVARRFVAQRDNEELNELVRRLWPGLLQAYEQVMKTAPSPPPLVIQFGTKGLEPEAIARHRRPHEGIEHSTITINPKAMGDYLTEVVKHELIHYVLGMRPKIETEMHPPEFLAMAELLGLPQRYRD